MPAGLGLGAESSWRNYREPEGLPTFSAAVKQLPGIQELVLSHVRTKPPALLFQLAPQLKAVHASTTARVGAFPVVQLFQSQPELQVLDLNGYDTYEPMVPNLVQALELHGAPALRQLRLGSLFTNKTELKGLFEAKWAGWDKLICLELPMWPSDAPALAALSKCTSLESVKIQVYDDHKDHDAAVDAVVACLADNCPLLRRLDVQAATGYFSPRSHPRAVTTASRFHSLSECIIGLLTTGREQKEHDAFLGAMAKVRRVFVVADTHPCFQVLQANPSMRILRVDAWQRPFEITVTKAFLEATIDVAPALQRLYVRADAALPAELTAIWFSKHPLCEWR